MKAKSFQKFAAKEVLKDYEDKKKIEIAKATEEARKESKDLIKECWLKQERMIELVTKLRACKTNLDLMMDDWQKLPFDSRNQRSVERKQKCDAWYGGEAANLEETIVKQENALALDERTMIGNVIQRYKKKELKKSRY